jgi:hypothetical protein
MMTRSTDQLISDLRVRALTSSSELPDVATLEMVFAAEAALGFSLPPLLTRIYTEVANGGFGPDYGLIGLAGGHLDDQHHDILSLYRQTCSQTWRQNWPRWPDGHLRILHWGCAMYTTIDCTTRDFRLFHFDPNPSEEELGVPNCLIPHSYSLGEFFEAWLDDADIMCDVFPGDEP